MTHMSIQELLCVEGKFESKDVLWRTMTRVDARWFGTTQS